MALDHFTKEVERIKRLGFQCYIVCLLDRGFDPNNTDQRLKPLTYEQIYGDAAIKMAKLHDVVMSGLQKLLHAHALICSIRIEDLILSNIINSR